MTGCWTTVEPRVVVESPDLLPKFVGYWQTHLPDMSDFPKLESSQLQFWLKKNKTKRAAKPHSMLKGVAGLRLNAAIDFALQHNTWCVSFRDKKGNLVDLVKAAILKVWVHYSCGMVRCVCLLGLGFRFAYSHARMHAARTADAVI